MHFSISILALSAALASATEVAPAAAADAPPSPVAQICSDFLNRWSKTNGLAVESSQIPEPRNTRYKQVGDDSTNNYIKNDILAVILARDTVWVKYSICHLLSLLF
ncbi:hypothetical protein COCMIDRAFT_26551 [Bipolaris oryzae ATCC 44560]|uniref:Uncharacterized protein n=1 Tax=Bipolaris oryzae ATCC 44560 TaxID=930090 RepID=W6ZCV2_COCMI|nr:uncharacterized protein COCMIDRAFT_26551 [Bipolaris oryzae ATCC 44560]EUC45239.1 hypothetical protein COCMIDRAFT_26551 [Bipolaris oryzae ATCC 44560]